MLKRFLLCLVAVSVCSTSQSVFAQQDFFFSFSNNSVQTTTDALEVGETGSVFIFSGEEFAFDAIDLNFTSSNPDAIVFTGGQGFGGVVDDTVEDTEATSPFTTNGDARFNSNTTDLLEVENLSSQGRFVAVNLTQNGVDPLGASVDIGGGNRIFFDPDFVPGVGSLLAEVEFTSVGGGVSELSFIPPAAGEIITLPNNDVATGATFGSVSVSVDAAAVPEPSSIALLALGFAGFAARRRR